MAINNVEIVETPPPSDAVRDAKDMSTIPEAATVRVKPGEDGEGWDVIAEGRGGGKGGGKGGPPFDVQAFVERVREAAGNGPIDFKPDPKNNRVVAKYPEERY